MNYIRRLQFSQNRHVLHELKGVRQKISSHFSLIMRKTFPSDKFEKDDLNCFANLWTFLQQQCRNRSSETFCRPSHQRHLAAKTFSLRFHCRIHNWRSSEFTWTASLFSGPFLLWLCYESLHRVSRTLPLHWTSLEKLCSSFGSSRMCARECVSRTGCLSILTVLLPFFSLVNLTVLCLEQLQI